MAKVGIIGGSGLGQALCGQTSGKQVSADTPFGPPSDAIIQTNWNGIDIAILNRHGPGHSIPPSMVNYRANIYALKAIGCTHIIASGAVGSLREEIAPKDLVIPDQVIDKTYRRVGTFFDGLAAHVEFAVPFCPVLRKHLLECKSIVNTKVHDGGTYVCMEGPAFSTRAESRMHRAWGGDLIGMTCMPEAKLAREAEIAYALVCLPSDYDCWREAPEHLDKMELLKEIIGNLNDATSNAIGLIKEAIARFARIADVPSPAHKALELALWTEKTKIPKSTIKSLGVLVDKYLK
ncbi:MAG: S-methyl-5'-thioadenosine phosphorylase [Planctomycetes bacterium]|nr:S-methyl-5'-thioadenosine phosphorylase [Planctomycetota bacterium]